MKRIIIVEKEELANILQEISEKQTRRGIFQNVAVKPYKGRKHPAEKELVKIEIG